MIWTEYDTGITYEFDEPPVPYDVSGQCREYGCEPKANFSGDDLDCINCDALMAERCLMRVRE